MKIFLKLSLAISFLSLQVQASDLRIYTPEEQFAVAIARQQAGTPFDAPLEREWLGFFDQAVSRVKAVINRSPDLSGPRKATLLSLTEKVHQEGGARFSTGDMDTHWYLFLHKIFSDILTQVQTEGEKSPQGQRLRLTSHDYKEFATAVCDTPADVDKFVGAFGKYYGIFKKHKSEILELLRKDHLVERTYGGGKTVSFSQDAFVDPETGSEIHLSFFHQFLPLQRACLYLPVLGEESDVFLSIEDLNDLYMHRVCPVGIPVEKTPFDATPRKEGTANVFSVHDEGHGRIFSQVEPRMDSLNLSSDPLLVDLFPLWQRIKETTGKKRPLLMAGFFMAVHEDTWDLSSYAQAMTLESLREVTSQKPNFSREDLAYHPDLLTFYQRCFEPQGLSIISVEPSSGEGKRDIITMDQDSISRVERDEIRLGAMSDFNQGTGTFQTMAFSHEPTKRQLFAYYEMLWELGVDVPVDLRTPSGERKTLETFDPQATIRFYQDVVFAALMDFKESK